jgi:hypothetical protein
VTPSISNSFDRALDYIRENYEGAGALGGVDHIKEDRDTDAVDDLGF